MHCLRLLFLMMLRSGMMKRFGLKVRGLKFIEDYNIYNMTTTIYELAHGETAGLHREKLNQNFHAIKDMITDMGFFWRGVYVNESEYEKGDVVEYMNSLYIAKTDTVGLVPLNLSAWDRVIVGGVGPQ